MVLGDRWINEGSFPSTRDVLRLAQAGTNAPHGAYLPVSLSYAVLARPFGVPGNYLALKLVAIGMGLLAMFVWIAVAEQLSTGPPGQAGFAMGLLFLFAPGEMLLGSLVPWGSHPEGILFGGLAALTALRAQQRRSPPLHSGFVIALAAAMSTLLAPTAFLLLLVLLYRQRDRSTTLVATLGGAFIGFVGPLLLSGSLGASVTEAPGATPTELVRSGFGSNVDLVYRSLLSVLPFPLSPDAVAASSPVIAGLGTLALLAAVAWQGWLGLKARAPLRLVLMLAVPVCSLLVLVLFAPRRPFIPPRYLLPLFPFLLLALTLTWSEAQSRTLRLLATAGLLVVIGPGISLQAGLIDLSRAGGFASYRPSDYTAADVGHVRYENADCVGRFLATRAVDSRTGFNFAAGVGASDSLLSIPLSERRLQAQSLLERREHWLNERDPAAPYSSEERRQMHENIGWGVAAFAPQARGDWLALLTRLDSDDAAALARGLGMGVAAFPDSQCKDLRADTFGPLGPALRQGFLTIRGSEACDAQLRY